MFRSHIRLTFIPHINYLSNKCLKALNVLRVVSSMEWGADKKVLMRLYRSLIRSKLDYGCVVYGSARKSYLRKLDTIRNQGLRLALGAFKTSPINSLYVEAYEPSLNLRRKKLGMQYYLKLKSNPDNPNHAVVFEPLYQNDFLKKENAMSPFSKIPNTPLWISKTPTFIYDLASHQKATTDPMIFRSKYLEIKRQCYFREPIFTDGSKYGDIVTAAAVVDGELYQFRLPDKTSIF